MPPADFVVTVDHVRRLLQQFAAVDPAAASGELRRLGDGWDNTCFRLGEDRVVRVPRRWSAVPLLANEVRWLPVLAEGLPVPVPETVFVGEAIGEVPWRWAVNRWLPGEEVLDLPVGARSGLADDLADALVAIHRRAPEVAPANPWRGVPLSTRPDVRPRILAAANGVVVPVSAWDAGVAAPPYEGPPVWLHGDPHPMNLLHVDGRLSGLIDFGDITAGDPASDLATAWKTFGPADRARFRARLDQAGAYDEHVWTRAAAWAASFASAMEPGSPLHPVAVHIADQLRADGWR